MAYYYIRKVAGFLVTLFLVSILTFAVFQILPGDPALVILGVDADPMQIEQLHQEMGIDQPIHIRFLSWIGGVLQGDLGTSYRYHQPVSDLIYSRKRNAAAMCWEEENPKKAFGLDKRELALFMGTQPPLEVLAVRNYVRRHWGRAL